MFTVRYELNVLMHIVDVVFSMITRTHVEFTQYRPQLVGTARILSIHLVATVLS